MRYLNHGQALQQLASNLDKRTVTTLTLQYLRNPKTPVAHLLATNDFVNIHESNTLDFLQHIQQVGVEDEERKEAMNELSELLTQDLKNTGGIVPEESDEDDEEGEEDIEIDKEDSWEDVWEKLRQVGWRKKNTQSGNVCWVFPGASRRHGVHGQDYFNTLEELQAYVRKEYEWNGISEKKQSANKRKGDDDGRVWGRPKKQATMMSTPQNQKTKPQDPAKPRLDSDEETSADEEDQYSWHILWDRLKAAGWTAVRAGKYNKLHDWYYVRPRRNVPEGELGQDYFREPSEVIDFVRCEDGKDELAKPASVVIMPSPRKRSRKVRAALEQPIEKSVPKAKPHPPKKMIKEWWFHKEPLPSFREVWSILHHKLDFRYTNGCYKLPTGDDVFPTDLDMRCHLLQHGIPNLEKGTEEDCTVLERWVTFVHVPVKDINSTIKLDGMQELSSEEASKILVNKLGFRQEGDGYRRGEHESFASLEEARVFFRGAESLAPPVEGRRRTNQNDVCMSDEQILDFRLWAALSPTPLPTFASSQLCEEDITTPVTEPESTKAVEQSRAIEGDQGATKPDAKENGMGKGGIFEDDGNFPRDLRRITMSPSKMRPLSTQPEE